MLIIKKTNELKVCKGGKSGYKQMNIQLTQMRTFSFSYRRSCCHFPAGCSLTFVVFGMKNDRDPRDK